METIKETQTNTMRKNGTNFPVFLEICREGDQILICQYCDNNRDIIDRYNTLDEATADFDCMVFEERLAVFMAHTQDK